MPLLPLSVPQEDHYCYNAMLNPFARPLFFYYANNFPALCEVPTILLGLLRVFCIVVYGSHAVMLNGEHMLVSDLKSLIQMLLKLLDLPFLHCVLD